MLITRIYQHHRIDYSLESLESALEFIISSSRYTYAGAIVRGLRGGLEGKYGRVDYLTNVHMLDWVRQMQRKMADDKRHQEQRQEMAAWMDKPTNEAAKKKADEVIAKLRDQVRIDLEDSPTRVNIVPDNARSAFNDPAYLDYKRKIKNTKKWV